MYQSTIHLVTSDDSEIHILIIGHQRLSELSEFRPRKCSLIAKLCNVRLMLRYGRMMF